MLKCTCGLLMIDRHWDSSDQVAAILLHWSHNLKGHHMKYMGSKSRIVKNILPIILKDRLPNQWYVEPFLGGANSIQHVDGNCLAGEFNWYIAEMWKELIKGWLPPLSVSKQQYLEIKTNPDEYEPCLVGWVAINCSYSGKWFGGYAGVTDTKGGVRDYQAEAHSNVMKQVTRLKDLTVKHSSYCDLIIPPRSIIYCDPPYEGTTKYKDKFNHDEFWLWCRNMVQLDHQVFISEYNAPSDFKCVWEKEVKSSLSANGVSGGNKKSVEKLFTLDVSFL